MESPGKDYLVGGGESNDVGRAFNHRNEQEHEHKQQHYNSQPLTGDGASPGKIFTGGLARETTIAQFIKHFGKYCEITDSVIMKDRKTGQPHGFGFITFADPLVVDKVIEDPHVIIGKQLQKNDILSNSIQTRSKAHQIIKRMLVSLGDPYTRYLSPNEFSKMARYDMTGIGINLREVTEDNGDHRLKVLGLILDGPTYSAGVRQEDEILVVNNMEVKGKSTFEVSSLLQGPNGTSITIQVKRGNRGPVESIEVQRQFVARTPVSYRMEQDESGVARVVNELPCFVEIFIDDKF